jgi:hypothetical protein
MVGSISTHVIAGLRSYWNLTLKCRGYASVLIVSTTTSAYLGKYWRKIVDRKENLKKLIKAKKDYDECREQAKQDLKDIIKYVKVAVIARELGIKVKKVYDYLYLKEEYDSFIVFAIKANEIADFFDYENIKISSLINMKGRRKK